MLERADCAVGASFVALKWWWNEDPATGSWVDLTPVPWPDGEQRLLVESPLGEKEEQQLSAAQRLARHEGPALRTEGRPLVRSPDPDSGKSGAALHIRGGSVTRPGAVRRPTCQPDSPTPEAP